MNPNDVTNINFTENDSKVNIKENCNKEDII